MICPKCNSTDVSVSMVTETKMKQKKKTLLYWLTIGWIIEPLLWFFLTVPKLIFELFKPSKYKMSSKTSKIAVCQTCGKSWKV